jgi:hypothetical protein
MDPKMLKEFNQQIQEETYSSYIYLSMAADLEASREWPLGCRFRLARRRYMRISS